MIALSLAEVAEIVSGTLHGAEADAVAHEAAYD